MSFEPVIQSGIAMSREDTLISRHSVTIKPKLNSKSYRYLILIVVITAVISAYFVFREPPGSLGDPSDSFVVTKIPKVYTKLETAELDDRDVFHGFRTSFLPPDEVILPPKDLKVKRDVGGLNLGSLRRRRMSHHVLPDLQDDEEPELSAQDQEDSDNNSYEDDDSTIDDSYESSKQYDERELDRIVHPEPHVDRGPFDDVVEQVRGQPELEEGEIETISHIYKPTRSYTGIHAFWKGQGDRDTIRKTQASIMKQYMDEEADPCQDFYQYACGNWASLNPIPADKAGYDTFEMLRENLDAVLKELLEFKDNEYVTSVYPGPHLDLSANILPEVPAVTRKLKAPEKLVVKNIEIVQDITKEIFNNSAMKAHRYDIDINLDEKPVYINRIKRNLKDKFKNKYKKHYLTNKIKYKRKDKVVLYNVNLSDNRKDKLRTKRITKRKPRDVFENTIDKQAETTIFIEEDPAKGDATLKARFLFKSCMNYDILHKRSHQPLLDLLDLLGGWPMLNPEWNDNNFEWLELMAKLRLYNNDILLSEWVGPDIKNSEEFVIQFDQTSLGLPTRDYFLQENNKVYLEAYKNYLIKIALLLGGEHSHVLRSATELIAFETRLAQITSAPEDRRNVSELYQRMSLEKLESLVPKVNWRKYLCIVMNRTVQSEETVVLFALTYVRHLVQLIEVTDSNTLANYLLWRFVRHRVNNLDDRFQSAKQQFYFILFGREQAPSRWKNCISQVNSNMGMALGSMFVQKYFDETSKNDTLTMTREIQQSFRELLHLTNWIDEETKQLAGHKVDEMMLRIGYPNFILHKKELNDRYKEVKIHPDKYFENILNILQHLTKMEQSRLGQPVNKTLWNTAPAVVNAYYSRNKNQIMFPAGILQPPFYHRHFPRSLNYGGIGVVIGHEITHGFDDKGRLFDCDGNLHRWWSDSAIEAFHERAQCLIDQYGAYVVPEVHMKLDGVNTQGENIADNGGVKQAFRAYLHWLSKHGTEGETLPELNHTHTQLFFLNFAQVWCGAMRPEAMRNKLKTAVHSPGRFRVIGTLSNSEDFARVFQCPPGSPMNPTNKCSVW